MNGWQHRGTLRFRLALWYGIVGALLFAAFSVVLYLYVRERMARPLDHQLRRDLDEVGRRLEVTADRRLLWNGRELSDNTPWTTQYPWFELWDENSVLVRRLWPFSENGAQQVLTAPAPGRETISVFNVSPDLRLRVLSVPYRLAGNEKDWMIRMMRVHEPVADALGALRWIIFIALPMSATLLVIGGYTITRKWLMPLGRMAKAANSITADNLSLRLPVENPDDEVGQLGTRFNTTLDRLQAAFIALDQFVADASHELRTPLTTLRSVGEVGLRRGRSVEEYREIIGSMLEEAERLQRLVGRLLELASAESGAACAHRLELSLDEFVQQSVEDLKILAEAKDQRILVEADKCGTRTDALLLRPALQNLVDNAIKFSPSGSTIRVQLTAHEKEIEIAVSDEGPGISVESQAHLMNRFFRTDPNRGRASGGFGLGLSITKAYMRMLNGTLAYQSRTPTGSTFRLVFPRH